MPKFRKYFRKMLQENQELFEDFGKIHTRYAEDKARWQDEFNRVGEKVVEVVKKWEGRLCGYSERGQYARFSSQLAEKFKNEVRAFFPLIDFVGVKISHNKQTKKVKEVRNNGLTDETDKDLLEIEKIVVLEDDFRIKRLL